MIAVLDYGIGNISSICNMLKKVGCTDVRCATKSSDLLDAGKIILPGVGAFDTGIDLLNESGMTEELIRQVAHNKKPIMGICLGMQMLGRKSEEGKKSGLGLLPFDCKRFTFDLTDLKVPHMGWDYVALKKDHNIVRNVPKNLRFYFVHSYYAVCDEKSDVLMSCDYGGEFAAAVQRDNIFGMQFHPEKSHVYGQWLLSNFVNEV